ncbi:MAG TPA: putative porin [Chthoniobacterales bacterium]|nr:putative porin [Chthoniobacterales bacterium]
MLLLLLPAHLPGQSSSDSERLEKLEHAVQQLQQRNAELEAEVKTLKNQREPVAAAAPATVEEGPAKTKATHNGKSYVEKPVEAKKSAGDKWKLSNPITELELFGDVRVRYEYRGGQGAENTNIPNDWQERRRERYRLRLGLRGTLVEDWFFGVRLETGAGARSSNVTFGDDSSTTSPAGGGPFAKGSDGINVGQAYFGYKGLKDLTLTVGKLPNPFVTTFMVWDADINPEGLAEQWKHTFNLGGGGANSPDGYTKDGKTIASTRDESGSILDLFANFGQFVYDEVNPENPIGPRSAAGGNKVPNNDAILLGWQVGGKFTFPNQLYAQIAPAIFNYTGSGDTFNTHFQGGAPGITNSASLAQNQTGINSLLIFDMPAEIGWKLGDLPMRLFADFAVNLEADDRAAAAGRPDKGDQRYAYQIGIGIGQLKKKNQWEVNVFWQHSQQYSLDPNLIDNDAFDARLNMEGVGLRAGYMLTDAVFFYAAYVYGWRIDDSLGTGGANDIAINPLNRYQIFQADLNVKF